MQAKKPKSKKKPGEQRYWNPSLRPSIHTLPTSPHHPACITVCWGVFFYQLFVKECVGLLLSRMQCISLSNTYNALSLWVWTRCMLLNYIYWCFITRDTISLIWLYVELRCVQDNELNPAWQANPADIMHIRCMHNIAYTSLVSKHAAYVHIFNEDVGRHYVLCLVWSVPYNRCVIMWWSG